MVSNTHQNLERQFDMIDFAQYLRYRRWDESEKDTQQRVDLWAGWHLEWSWQERCYVRSGETKITIDEMIRQVQDCMRPTGRKRTGMRLRWQLYRLRRIGLCDEEIAWLLNTSIIKVRIEIGRAIMTVCRRDVACPFKALLPEKMLKTEAEICKSVDGGEFDEDA